MQGFKLPPKDAWEYWAVVLGVVAVLFTAIRNPVVWVARRMLRALLAPELKRLRTAEESVKAHDDVLVSIRAIQDTQGVALREIPRMSGLMEQMTSAIDRLDGTLQTMASQQLDHGKELGRVTGFIEAEGWRGPERRKRGRRTDDPPLEDSHG